MNPIAGRAGFELVTLLLAALVTGGTVPRAAALDVALAPPAVASQPVAASEIRVTDQGDVAIAGRIYAVSPDGRWIAGSGSGESGLDVLCAYPVAADETAHVCVDLPAHDVARIDYQRLVWSPDGTRLAFTEDGPRIFTDSDIWVFEAESGTLTNLTDDGVVGGVRPFGETGEQEPFAMDILPAWSPDGQEIAFVRSAWEDDDWQGTRLMRIPAAGGEAVEILEVTPDEPFAVYFRIAHTPDGERLVFTRAHADTANPNNGVWSVGLDGGDPRHLAGRDDPEAGYPVLVEISPHGDRAIVVDLLRLLQFQMEETYSILDLDDGTIEPLEVLSADAPDYQFVRYATFSPDGTKLLYRSSPDPAQILVRDVDGTEEYPLLDLERTGGIDDLDGLIWLPDGTIFTSLDIDAGVLLSVAPSPR